MHPQDPGAEGANRSTDDGRPLSAPAENPFPLSMATDGQCLQVAAVCGGAALLRRVAEMGLGIGSQVTVRHRHGDSMVVIRGETRYALGAGITHKILVVHRRAD